MTGSGATAFDPGAILRIALEAAREAGALAQAGWRTRPTAEHKGRVDLVTRFDRESETLLRARLAATPFPVVGEEAGGERAAGLEEPTWYVDPIDGTTNFVHGHFFFCVSIGVARAGHPIAGAVVAPGCEISAGTDSIISRSMSVADRESFPPSARNSTFDRIGIVFRLSTTLCT